MQNFKTLLIFFLLAASMISNAQNSGVIRNYVATYKDLAIAEMQRTGVPASIKLAQGIHETMAGTSQLVLKSNNHFGIKCKSNWAGESVSHDDDARGECFRKYLNAEDSYRDHSNFLKNSQRYASLFLLEPIDYEGWANGLKKAGYATNPKYPQVLIKLVEDYGLQEYTLVALGKKVAQDEIAANTQKDTTSKEVGEVKSMSNNFENKDSKESKEEANMAAYPQGEFKINETRVIYLRQGTSFLFVAQQYNVPLARLFEFNEIKEAEASDKDQLIYLQRKRKTGDSEFHIVQPGENLHDIAQKQGIRLESLLEHNWLKANERPAPGEQLNLQKKSASMPKLMVKENYSLYSGREKQATN